MSTYRTDKARYDFGAEKAAEARAHGWSTKFGGSLQRPYEKRLAKYQLVFYVFQFIAWNYKEIWFVLTHPIELWQAAGDAFRKGRTVWQIIQSWTRFAKTPLGRVVLFMLTVVLTGIAVIYEGVSWIKERLFG